MFENFYETALVGIFVVAAVTAVALMFVNAPYGRYQRTGWGPTLPSTWGWVIMETPAVLTILVMFLLSPRTENLVALGFVAMWELHYLYRTYVFPFRRRGGGRPIPVTIVLMAVLFNLWNGFLNGAWLFHLGPIRDVTWFLDPRFIAGLIVFLVGMYINRSSDSILMKLRAPGETVYRIPTGGLYRHVSMPAYFGEIVEWTGFAVATWSLSGASFAVFTAANLVPRALANHRWYRDTFPDYPKDRKAIIPFVL